MKTFIKIVLLSFLFIIGFSALSQAQSGKGAYGNTISRRQFGSKTADHMTRGLRFNADVCAGMNIDPSGDVNVTAGAGYQFSPYVYLGAVIGSGYTYDGPKVIVAADGRVYFTKKRVTPMLSAQLGYMLHADKDYVMSGYFYNGKYKGEKWEYKRVNEHLVYASGGIGARIYLTKKLGFTARFMASTSCYYSAFLGLCAGIEF